jgi:hypothetical protein
VEYVHHKMMETLLHGNDDLINTVTVYANPESDLYQVRFEL